MKSKSKVALSLSCAALALMGLNTVYAAGAVTASASFSPSSAGTGYQTTAVARPTSVVANSTATASGSVPAQPGIGYETGPTSSPTPSVSSALTVCGEGKLTKIERIWGSGNTVRIATESSPAPYGSYRTVPGLGNMTEMTFGATATDREKDRLNLLQLAVASKLPVQIVTSGQSCVGTSDAFDITLCTEGAACAQPR